MDNDEKLKDLLKRVEEIKNSKEFDLSTEEDLSIAIMNLISLEEHFFFTSVKTDKAEYMDLLSETREIRKELLKKMIDHHEGETWCISKHLLAATMRMMEVGTKYLSDGKKDDAKRMFQQSYRVYSLFWALRLKLLTTEGIRKIPDGSLNKHSSKENPWRLEDLVNKLVDCCDEK